MPEHSYLHIFLYNFMIFVWYNIITNKQINTQTKNYGKFSFHISWQVIDRSNLPPYAKHFLKPQLKPVMNIVKTVIDSHAKLLGTSRRAGGFS